MDDDTAFRLAIRADLHDDTRRLVYADWLDERGDPRAEFLRVECELRQTWSYATPRPELSKRLAALRRQLDPAWLADVRRCTTPTPPADIAAAVPALKRLARTAVRLHPRAGEDERDASKIGGAFLWPRGRAWPSCETHGCPLVAAVQLRKEDVPEVGFKRGTDLLQLLWCPRDHDPSFCPAVEAHWWKRAAVRDPVDPPPPGPGAADIYLPRPCRIYPERVTDYPDASDLGRALEDRVEASGVRAAAVEHMGRKAADKWGLPDDPMLMYQRWLGPADGTKVGGHPGWAQGPDHPKCRCGATMELMVTFDSLEFNGGTWGRWVPVQERDAISAKYEVRTTVQKAAGVTIGDANSLYVFACRRCPSRPIRAFMQCS